MWDSYDDKLISQLLDSRRLALLNLAKTKINSFIKWDVIRFFYLNPYTTDTAENIARYMGRETKMVELEVEELVGSGILEKKILNNKSVYFLTIQESLRPLVDQFILACEDRFFRIKAVEYILRGMR